MRAGSSYPPQNSLEGGGSGSSATETGNEQDVDILFDDEFDDDDEDDEEDESGGLRNGDEGQALIGGIEAARAQLEEEEGGRDPARATETGSEGDGGTTRDVIGKVGDGQAVTGGTTIGGDGGGGQDGLEPWAHRDIKPVSWPRLRSPHTSSLPLSQRTN